MCVCIKLVVLDVCILVYVLSGLPVFVGTTNVWLSHRKWRLHRQRQVAVEEALTGISILKPLIGVDPHLYENLETFFKIDYPLVCTHHHTFFRLDHIIRMECYYYYFVIHSSFI